MQNEYKMSTVNYNIRLDKDLKENSAQVFNDYGISLSQGIKMILTQIVKTKEIPVSLDYCNTVNEQTKQDLLQSMAEFEAGQCDTIQTESVEDALKQLTEIAKNL